MLVNGIPITSAFLGNRSNEMGGMPLENVQRIEVIRGPGSALYGADAFAGVINVITKNAANINGTEFGVRAGSFNTSDAYMQYGGKMGTLDAAFYLREGNTNGSQAILQKDAVGASGPLSTENTSIDARADLSRDAWRFRASYQHRDLGLGAGLGGALDPNARVVESRMYLDLNYDQANWAQNWDVSGVAGYYNLKQDPADPYFTLVPAGVIPGFPNGMIGNPAHSEQHPHGSISAVYTGFEQHRVRIGTGAQINDLYSVSEVKNFTATFGPQPGNPPVLVDATGNPALVYEMPHKRTVEYAFAQDEWSIAKDWTLTAGVRNDHYSDFGGTTNPRLALVWDAAYNLEVKAMHGSAFRAPSFSELYSINNPVTDGNPSLQPERIVSDELAFSWQQTIRLKSNLNFFHYRMSNTIFPVGVVFQNVGGQTGRGLEWEETYDATGNLRLTGNISLQRSIDDTTGQDAGLAPHKHLFARSDWHFDPLWQFGTTVNYVADRMRQPGDTRPQIPDYTTVDLTLRREKVAGDWNATTMVTNLFGSNALEPTPYSTTGQVSDLPLPGRAIYVMLQHKI